MVNPFTWPIMNSFIKAPILNKDLANPAKSVLSHSSISYHNHLHFVLKPSNNNNNMHRDMLAIMCEQH